MPCLGRATDALCVVLLSALVGVGSHRADAALCVDAAVGLAPEGAGPVGASSAPTPRQPIDGRAFPEGVLALTWDDGPDRDTLELARFLHQERVPGTFFVVGEWVEQLSQDPGWGRGVFATGHARLPVLAELVALGHRIGNHTQHHVLLTAASPAQLQRELAQNQLAIAPFVAERLPMFRAPGGAWNDAAARALDAAPELSALVGPISCDVDQKDWENAVYDLCQRPSDCEPGPRGPRVKASVTAKAYLDAIVSRGHGIVLLHDRVGDVGSRYALDVARALVPALVARGYVFAAPVLGFSTLSLRMPADAWPAVDPASLVLADVNGDGRADACVRAGGRVVCALSELERDALGLPRTVFRAPRTPIHPPSWVGGALRGEANGSHHGDLNGDGRPDACASDGDGVSCALAGPHGLLAATRWLRQPVSAFALGDVNGDGRADLCAWTPEGLACAMAP